MINPERFPSPQSSPLSRREELIANREQIIADAPYNRAIGELYWSYEAAPYERTGKALEARYQQLGGGLVSELMTPEVQGADNSISIGATGYLLLAQYLNGEQRPTYDQVSGLQRLVVSDNTDALLNDPSLTLEKKSELQQAIEDVKEKTNKEYWALDEDTRNWYERITNAPDLTEYTDTTPPPPERKEYPIFMKRSKVESDQPTAPPSSLTPRELYEHKKKVSDSYVTNIAPPPFQRISTKVSNRATRIQKNSKNKNGILHKVKNNKFVSPPRHPDPNDLSKAELDKRANQQREKRLTSDELTRLREEFSVDNLVLNKRAKSENLKIGFAHAKIYALNALAFDDEYRLERARRARTVANNLGWLGVRNAHQEAEFSD